jgi:hypothetical protein
VQSAGTQNAYSSYFEHYRDFCERRRKQGELGYLESDPLTDAKLEDFAGNLKKSTFKGASKTTIFAAALSEVKHNLTTAEVRSRLFTALERGEDDSEQAFPLGLAEFRALFRAAVTQKDIDVCLALAGAFFFIKRRDEFVSLKKEHIVFTEGLVKARFVKTKGKAKKLTNYWIELEALPDAPALDCLLLPGLKFCPVTVMKLLTSRATSNLIAFSGKDASMLNHLKHLIPRSGLQVRAAGRSRDCYSVHSTRVGAACTLLKAGLSGDVVKSVADWDSQKSLDHYAQMVTLQPSLVEAFRFYNPEALKNKYV